jgi:hypothetical protein
MATRRPRATNTAGDRPDIAALLRSTAHQIRRDARARYERELQRADTLDNAADTLTPSDSTNQQSPMAVATPAVGTDRNNRATTKRTASTDHESENRRRAAATTRAQPTATGLTLMERVVSTVRDHPQRQWNTAQVAATLRAAPTSVATYLERAAERGLITRAGRGTYQAP